MPITVTQLTSFVAVARGGSVTAAADALVVTQPSVSSALAALARELGCDLFERSGRGIRLTDAGGAFLPYASDVLGLLGRGRTAAREAAELAACRLRIAAVTTAAESFVPPLMHAYAVGRPDVELTLDVGNRNYVLDRALNHAADVAFSGRPPTDARLRAEPLHINEIVCMTAPDDPLADGTPRATSALARCAWLLREPGSGTRDLVEQFLRDRGIAPRTLTLGSNGSIRQAAMAGLGVSLLSKEAVASDLAAGRLGQVTLLDGPPTRPWFMLSSTVGRLSEVVEGFLALVRAQP